MASRWHGRQATDDEIADALRNDPSEDLFPPHGAFLIARMADAVVGCAGLRRTVEGSGEVKRMLVLPAVGYVEVPAFNSGRYAEHWFEKDLLGTGEQPRHR